MAYDPPEKFRPFGDVPEACNRGLLQAHYKAARSLRALLLADGYGNNPELQALGS